MTKEQRIEFLEQTHKDLHARIEVLEAETAQTNHLQNAISELKKRKLQTKDAINHLRAEIG